MPATYMEQLNFVPKHLRIELHATAVQTYSSHCLKLRHRKKELHHRVITIACTSTAAGAEKTLDPLRAGVST